MEIFKKLEVPEELPDIQLEETESGTDSSIGPQKIVENDILSESIPENENSYFQELLQKLQSNNPKDIESVHRNSNDILGDMKEYWAKQTSPSMIGQGKELKNKLLEKIHIMRHLEKDWQAAYFSLIEKEEQLKKEETELKEYLAEFVEFCKRKS